MPQTRGLLDVHMKCLQYGMEMDGKRVFVNTNRPKSPTAYTWPEDMKLLNSILSSTNQTYFDHTFPFAINFVIGLEKSKQILKIKKWLDENNDGYYALGISKIYFELESDRNLFVLLWG